MAKVLITTTVDWDAYDKADYSVFDAGVAAIDKLNKRHSHVKLTHFICAAYFTRGKAAANHYRDAIKHLRKKRSDDEIGLHVHCWKSLMKYCGMLQKEKPTYHHWDNTKDGRPKVTLTGGEDTGHGVPLGSYDDFQIQKILEKSRDLLVSNGVVKKGEIESFRCGGWLASDSVLRALEKVKIKYDASAADARFVSSINGTLKNQSGTGFKLGDWIVALWGAKPSWTSCYIQNNKVIRLAYPKGIQIHDKQLVNYKQGLLAAQPKRIWKNLVEVPNTALLADYVTKNHMIKQIDIAVDLAQTQSDPVHVSLGFHVESATWHGIDYSPSRKNLKNIEKIDAVIKETDRKHKGKIEYLTVKEAGRRI